MSHEAEKSIATLETLTSHWSWERYEGFVMYLSEWQRKFEVERSVNGANSESLWDYNSVGLILTRGINSESAEAIEHIDNQDWNGAKLELVDQLIFLSSLFNHLEMSDKEVGVLRDEYWLKMAFRAGNGRTERLLEGQQLVSDHAGEYALQFDNVHPRVFSKGEFDLDSVIQIQSLIQQEALEAYRKHRSGDLNEVRLGSVAVMIHLGYLFQVMDMNVDDVAALAYEKMSHNERKYGLEWFGNGVPIGMALKTAKLNYNNGSHE